MSKWYGAVLRDPENFDVVLQACDWFEAQYEAARKELKTDGRRIEEIEMRMPGVMEERFAQLQELEAILGLLETRENKTKVDRMRQYLEHYQRTLSDRTAEKYADVHDDVQTIRLVRQQVAHVRNLFLAFMKGFETLSYRLADVTKLRAAGLEDSTL